VLPAPESGIVFGALEDLHADSVNAAATSRVVARTRFLMRLAYQCATFPYIAKQT
jgi:hypothetical protein